MKTTCSRGHVFEKGKETPVCPKCWPGYYRKGVDLPRDLGAPAIRALLGARLDSLVKLSKRTEKEILALHGVGPSAIPKLRKALKVKELSFR